MRSSAGVGCGLRETSHSPICLARFDLLPVNYVYRRRKCMTGPGTLLPREPNLKIYPSPLFNEYTRTTANDCFFLAVDSVSVGRCRCVYFLERVSRADLST